MQKTVFFDVNFFAEFFFSSDKLKVNKTMLQVRETATTVILNLLDAMIITLHLFGCA